MLRSWHQIEAEIPEHKRNVTCYDRDMNLLLSEQQSEELGLITVLVDKK
jgi:hypothetical protein